MSAAARNSPIWEIRTFPSTADGVVFLNETEAMPGAPDMERVIAEPSNTGPAAVPAAANIRLINAVIWGSKDISTESAAEPSAESEPLIRPAQEKNGKMTKHKPKHKKQCSFIQ
jgi:hypothetical protein